MKIPVRTAALANLSHWRAGQGGRIKANAEQWGIKTTREQWEKATKQERKDAA